MKKKLINVLYVVVGLLLIGGAICWLGQCRNLLTISNSINGGSDSINDNRDTDTIPDQNPTTSGDSMVNSGDMTTGSQQDTISSGDQQDPTDPVTNPTSQIEVDLSGEDDYNPEDFEDDDINELLNMLEDMLGIE